MILSIYVILLAFLPLLYWLSPELGRRSAEAFMAVSFIKAILAIGYYIGERGLNWKLNG